MAVAVKKLVKKLVIVGDGYCGKTSLHQWRNLNVDQWGSLPSGPSRAYEYKVDIELDGQQLQVKLAMCDTYGVEGYDRMRLESYPCTDVFLVCFAVNNRSSFINIEQKWILEVKHHCPDVPIILVATKKDLRNDPATIEKLAKSKEKPLTTKDGEVMANRIGAAAYVECSALTKEGVREVFEIAARHALALNLETKEDRERKCCIC